MSDEEPSGTLDPQRYDDWFEQPWGRHAFAVERDALLAALGPLQGRRLVEVGCDTGRFTAALTRAGAEVTGIDVDPAMLDLAATRVDVPLLLADAHTLPLDDDTYDVAVAVTLLEHQPRPPAHRVRARPGHPPWSDACLHTPRQLRDQLTPHGQLRMHGALHAPGMRPGLIAALSP